MGTRTISPLPTTAASTRSIRQPGKMNHALRRALTRAATANDARFASAVRTQPLNLLSQDYQVRSASSSTVPTLGWSQQLPYPIVSNYHSQSRNSFHTTAAVQSFAVRRRRRGAKRVEETAENIGEDEDNATASRSSSPLQHTPIRDVLQFRQAASDLFDKLERALTPMKAKNDPFVISRLQGDIGEVFQLDLGPKEGLYQLEISEDECVFEYSSPISGKILYCLSATSGEWVGVHDGNAFEGILVRDLIRQCQGLPDL